MNELGFSGEAICDNKVHFPAVKEDQEGYAQAVAHTVTKLNEFPLHWMERFYKAINDQVGYERLYEAKRVNNRLSTRYYLWTTHHPKWELVVRIVTLGASILLARKGQASYEAMSPTLTVARSINQLSRAITDRKTHRDNLANTIRQGVDSKFKTPEAWASSLEEYNWNDGRSNTYFYKSLKDRLSWRVKEMHSSPSLYQNEARFNALTQVYDILECDNWLNEIEQDKAVYVQNRTWVDLTHDVQMKLLTRMASDRDRFLPLLQTRLGEYLQTLPWDVLSKLDRPLRKATIQQAEFLMNTFNQEDLKQTFATLKEHIQLTIFKDCTWQNEEADFIRSFCEDIGLLEEFKLARDTFRIEKNWQKASPQDRLENTKAIVADAKHYEKELDARRHAIFAQAKILNTLPFEEWQYVVAMLQALKPVYEHGCTVCIRRIKEQLLISMKDKEARENEERREDFIQKAKLLDIDPKIIDDLGDRTILGTMWMLITTGKRTETRLAEYVEGSLLDERTALRKGGEPTEIARMLTDEDLDKLTLTTSHYKVKPPSVLPFVGECNIFELMEIVRQADAFVPEPGKPKLIPAQIGEVLTNGTTKYHTKAFVFESLHKMLNYALNPPKKNGRIDIVLNILKHYTVQLKGRLKECKTKEETKELYLEVIEHLLIGMGLAYNNCEDRKYNTAMIIFNEKLANSRADDASIPVQVLVWAAKKRDELLVNCVHSLIQEKIQKNNENKVLEKLLQKLPQSKRSEATSRYWMSLDIASAVGYWRYEFQNELALGKVPDYAHDLYGTLTREQILERFNATYTAQWLLEQAMVDHKDNKGTKVLKIGAIDDLLRSRISNYEEMKYDLLDEDSYELLARGMALFLQEAGLFNALV